MVSCCSINKVAQLPCSVVVVVVVVFIVSRLYQFNACSFKTRQYSCLFSSKKYLESTLRKSGP